jgi:hypothetical protein
MSTKLLLLFLYSFLILSVFSTRILKEENNEEENQENNEPEEETDENEKQEETDFSKISSSKIRKENLPHSKVLLPIRRMGTSNMQIGDGPCGGIEKKASNTLTTKGATINFIWEIMVPENSGNCTVKISNGLQNEENFILLKPVDGEVNEDGSFKCGREKGFENKDFILPNDYECDGCTLQWTWSTSYGEIYSCSDIIINGGKLNKCMGKCLNGGTCFNGECLCVKGFSGEFCENEKGQSSLTWLWILLGLIILGIVGYLIYKYWDKIQSWFKRTQTWITTKNNEVISGFDEKKNDQPIDSNNLEENSKFPNI